MIIIFRRLSPILFILLWVTSAHAQDSNVVVVPLGGDGEDISECKIAEFCFAGKATLRCPSGDTVIECSTAPKTVFLSSSVHTANLGGLVGADAICQGLATDAGLNGEFKAWLSGWVGELDPFSGFILSSSRGPRERFTRSTGPYQLVDGTIVAYDFNDLFTGSIRNPIDLNEIGQPLMEEGVWTNTDVDGYSHGSVPPCDDFSNTAGTSFLSSSSSLAGTPLFSNSEWTAAGQSVCAEVHHIYCFEQ
ncbi:hypothetical protein N9060_00915 [Arenicella sp.]|nr:hypothetical protein [Arenicella sp.]